MGKGYIDGQMESSTMEVGLKVSNMGKVHTLILKGLLKKVYGITDQG